MRTGPREARQPPTTRSVRKTHKVRIGPRLCSCSSLLSKWAGKMATWATERSKESQWSDVRALNADDLVAWLGQAPAVAHWFARLIGKLPATGVVPLSMNGGKTGQRQQIPGFLLSWQLRVARTRQRESLSGFEANQVTTTFKRIRQMKPSPS